ncbi:hypothetical protein MMC06_000908 [Schaereria dolodes]|nr:hypothetical protein [Schaereria dolodes]
MARSTAYMIQLLLLLLVIFPPALTFESGDCDAMYGSPSKDSCLDLLFDNHDLNTKGLESIDSRSHLFALADIPRPSGGQGVVTNAQWRYKVALPLDPPRKNDGCSLALMVLTLLDGTVTFDTGKYKAIANQGLDIVMHCLVIEEPSYGGWTYTGDNRRLGIVLYEESSPFGVNLQQQLAAAAADPQAGPEEALDLEH